MNDIEFELQTRFAELRAADQASAPDFESMRGRPASEAARSARPVRRWVAPALLAAAVAGIVVVWGASRAQSHARHALRDVRQQDTSLAVIRWTMPTDGLLDAARQTLQTPSLTESVLDGAATPIPGTPFKGD
jgi:hypothetical protein